MSANKAQGWGKARPREFAGRNILPRAHAPLRTFMVAMAVMCYLAAMAMGGMIMTWRAIDAWKAGVTSEATAQIMPLEDGRKGLRSRVAAAAALLTGQKGVAGVRVLSDDENRALLEPWLGKAGLVNNLPIPRLIAVRLAREHPADARALDKILREKVKGARLDAHGRWVLELSDMARTAGWLGVSILLGIALAAVVLVTYAARAALEGNRETIEVLHLVGAKDRFIARQVERRFLRAGFVAALAGVAAAWVTFLVIALLSPSGGIGGQAWGLLFGEGRLVVRHYAAWLIIVLLATLISLVSARLAVIRILHGMFRQG